jgi:hypothetical protein
MSCSRESTHIGTYFGYDDFGAALSDTGHFFNFIDGIFIMLHLIVDDVIKIIDASGHIINMV